MTYKQQTEVDNIISFIILFIFITCIMAIFFLPENSVNTQHKEKEMYSNG